MKNEFKYNLLLTIIILFIQEQNSKKKKKKGGQSQDGRVGSIGQLQYR